MAYEGEQRIELYGDSIGAVEYVDHLGSDLSIVNSARVSHGKRTDSIDGADDKLIKYLLEHQHTSPLEHCAITFRFMVPMYISKQHMRHRTWSYNEISRRYTDINIEFYEPNSFRTQHKSNRQASNADELINPTVGFVKVPHGVSSRASNLLKLHHERSLHLYEALVSAGVCREQARGVLPQNLYTEYYGTANLNNIFKFVALRLPSDAQWEIQQVARGVLQITRDCYPIATKHWITLMAQKNKTWIKTFQKLEMME